MSLCLNGHEGLYNFYKRTRTISVFLSQKQKAMEKLIFETNVQTPSFINRIQQAVQRLKGIHHWQIDLDSIYNLLTVEGVGLNHIEIESELASQGVQASRLYEE